MKQDIIHLVETAVDQMKEHGLSESTINSYYERVFSPLLNKYKKAGLQEYNQGLMDELLEEIKDRFSHNLLSSSAKKMKCRGFECLQKLYETGEFSWPSQANPKAKSPKRSNRGSKRSDKVSERSNRFMESGIFKLIETAVDQMKEHGLSESTIKKYRNLVFTPILNKYKKAGLQEYNQTLMDELLQEIENRFSQNQLSAPSKNMKYRGFICLQKLHETGEFIWPSRANPKIESLEKFNNVIDPFIDSLSLSETGLRETRKIIAYFLLFLEDNDISLSEITPDTLREYFYLKFEARPGSVQSVLTALRKFFAFLKNKGYSVENCQRFLTISIPARRVDHIIPAIPKDDLEKILLAVDLNASDGKRDYAIISLEMTSGLRASDLATLKISDIKWRECEIVHPQRKTKKPVHFPIKPAVRDALADYILHERPKSDSEFVFLTSSSGNPPFKSGREFSKLFNKYRDLAGIKHVPNDGKTIHGARRSLGTRMTEEGIPLTTVSQTLGHRSVRPTRHYISLDCEGLKICTLSMEYIGDRK